MNEIRDFKEDMKLNKYKLDKECEMHSGIYYYYCEELSSAKSDLDEHKDKLSFMESEFELELRKNPPDDMKVTEPAIKACLAANKELFDQRKRLTELKKTIYHLEAAVKALEHKKNMIGHLVNLYTMKYYSEPKDKGGIERREVDDEVRKNLNDVYK